LKNFDRVTLACVHVANQSVPTAPLDSVQGADRLSFVPLPQAWTPHVFVGRIPETVWLLRGEIAKADYLHFAIGGLWGDWASVAAITARAMGRPFAVWTDRVESDVHRKRAAEKKGARWLYTAMTATLMKIYETRIIRLSSLGLFHGADCFEAYREFCVKPHLVHNIHIGPTLHIQSSRLEERLSTRDGPLRIAYSGRVHRDKGVRDWIEAIRIAVLSNCDISATWFGDGPEICAAKEASRGLPISFPGTLPHGQLLEELKTFDVFVFCHKTLESPRCLIEALACGLPIVGYHSPYPAQLISASGGGALVPKDDIKAVAAEIARVERRPELLCDLSRRARQDGSTFTDEAVFEHRSLLMKEFLR